MCNTINPFNGAEHENRGTVVGFNLDVPGQKVLELKKQIKELEQKNQLLYDYFINISHEIKTPISIMMLAINLLDQKNLQINDADIVKYSSILKQNSYRLLRIVSNLLDITKIESGYMDPYWEYIDVISLLNELIHSVDIYAAQKGLHIEFISSQEEKHMYTDSFMFERIILNLISNAIKHTPVGGAIVVSCFVYKRKIKISIKDNGEGIPDDKKEIIFDRFSQATSSLTRLSEGCGIGLALTKSLTELLSGHIHFSSTVGEGSEFIIELPLLDKKGETTLFTIQSGTNLKERVEMELSDIVNG